MAATMKSTRNCASIGGADTPADRRRSCPGRGGARARLRLGNAVNLRERSRDVRLLPWLDSLLRDVRFGVRMLRKDASVTGAAIASLALAMGAAIAAFILIDALILRPLPVPQPERLVYLAVEDTERDHDQIPWFSYPTFISLQKAASGRAGLFAASFSGPAGVLDRRVHRRR
jgi:hypothetical protein